MKFKNWIIVPIVAVCLSFVQGCATTTKSISKDEFQSIPSMKIARTKSPDLLKPTAGSNAIAITGIMFGAIGGGIGGGLSAAAEAKSGKKLIEKCDLPDFGDLVMDKFSDEVLANKDEFPDINIENNPVDNEYIEKSNEYILLLGFNLLKVDNTEGLTASTVLKLIDPSKEVLSQKMFTYKSRKYNRFHKLKEFEADDGKLLHEEYKFAVDETIKNLLLHLNVGQGLREVSGHQNESETL